jgi:hypothetical protein
MSNKYFLLISLFFIGNLTAQEIDPDLIHIKERMDSVKEFTANLQLDVDIDFIKMPTKYAKLIFRKGKPIKFSSDDFILIPKRGLDFTLSEIFKNDFITVDRGWVERNGKSFKKINIIPIDNKSDYSIATIILDVENIRVESWEISTKKNGSYVLNFSYEDKLAILPYFVEVNFEIERIKIPLSFMGKGTEVDKMQLKSTEESKTGKIFLKLSNYQIKSHEQQF